MIIDCHGHQTIVPQPHLDYREQQKARLKDQSLPEPTRPDISDDEIRRLQPEPGPFRRAREQPPADRPLLVSVLRENG